MSLNIKNEEPHRRAKELARIAGETITDAVDRAISERLDRIQLGYAFNSQIPNMLWSAATWLVRDLPARRDVDLVYLLGQAVEQFAAAAGRLEVDSRSPGLEAAPGADSGCSAAGGSRSNSPDTPPRRGTSA